MKVIIGNEIKDLTPEILAKAFWNMDSTEQSRFFNHLDEIANFKFPFQLQGITDEDGLTLAGRRVMQSIGEYSHWGITCKIMDNAI